MSRTAILNALNYLWAEAFNWTTYLRNRLPHSALQGGTPYEALYNKRPSIGHLQPFYTKCFVTIFEPQCGSKLEPRAFEGHLTGYIGKSLVRIYIPSKRKVDLSRLGNVRCAPADCKSSTSIEIEAPASSISTSDALKIPDGIPGTSGIPDIPKGSTPKWAAMFTMPGAFDDDDMINQSISSSSVPQSSVPAPVSIPESSGRLPSTSVPAQSAPFRSRRKRNPHYLHFLKSNLNSNLSSQT